MQRRLFGPTGREVAVVGMGTWYFEQADRRTAIAALRRGLDLGMNHIDTAEMYGSGVAEAGHRRGHRRPPRRGLSGFQSAAA